MFEADVPAAWCAVEVPIERASVPSWIEEILASVDEDPAPPVASVRPTLAVQAKPDDAPHSEGVMTTVWTPAVSERAPASVPLSSRRSRPMVVQDRREIETLHVALAEAVAAGARARREALIAAEREVVELALAIGAKIIGREIALDPALVIGWAREGLAALADRDEAVIAISPDLAARVPDAVWSAALDGRAPIVDRALAAGGCEVRGAHGRVDAGLGPRLSAVATALEGAIVREGDAP